MSLEMQTDPNMSAYQTASFEVKEKLKKFEEMTFAILGASG